MSSNFTGNSFNYVFCTVGCIYYYKGTGTAKETQVEFINNTYANIFGTDGTILLSDVVTQETRHTFIEEKLNYVQVGAYRFQGRDHETLIEFRKTKITNSYGGLDYALIHVQNAA